MKLAMYQDCISPHQIPLAKELAGLVGPENFSYVYRDKSQDERLGMGWDMSGEDGWLCYVGASKEEPKSILENAECLISGMRDVELFERRAKRGLKTIYQSERWFKPRLGILRLFKPSYFQMAKKFAKLLRNGKAVEYFPIGIHAARDMARLCGLFAGDLRCLFRAPKLDFERRPGGRIFLHLPATATAKFCLDKMRMWGYFVEPSQLPNSPTPNSSTLKVLWVGRLLKLKRVDTIIRAVGELATHSFTHPLTHSQLSLDIYGTGPEETRLKKLAAKYDDVIKFYPPVPIDEVRRLMREHDVYVLASNAYEGWGAVVSEALEEGMKVIGTYEAGSSATILPKECLFYAGEWKGLLELLQSDIPSVGIGEWTAKGAAEVMKG